MTTRDEPADQPIPSTEFRIAFTASGFVSPGTTNDEEEGS